MCISDWSSDVCSSDLPFQNGTAKGADAWAIFHEQLHISPINGLQHGTDQCRGGRNNGPDHDRVVQKAPKEEAPRTQKSHEADRRVLEQRSFSAREKTGRAAGRERGGQDGEKSG